MIYLLQVVPIIQMKKIQEFFLETKPVSWNQIATSHWRKYKKYKDELAEHTFYTIKKQGIESCVFPVEILVEVSWKDKRKRDVDNIFIKPILDTLVRENILKDDNCEYVRSVYYTGKIGEEREGIRVILLQ